MEAIFRVRNAFSPEARRKGCAPVPAHFTVSASRQNHDFVRLFDNPLQFRILTLQGAVVKPIFTLGIEWPLGSNKERISQEIQRRRGQG